MELLETQPTYGKLAEAIAKAQAEMSNPKFDKVNPHFKNKFASLAAVRDAVVPVLAKHGVSCLQDVQNVPGGVSCTTMLIHASGEMLKLGPLTMPASKGDAQGFGSAATYARRYHLMAVANVVGDEDDDANEATGKPAPATQLKPGIGVHDPRPDTSAVDPAQVNDFVTRLAATFEQDLTERQQEDAVYAMHLELCHISDELYVAVADAMAANKVISKQAWKTAIGNARKREKAAA